MYNILMSYEFKTEANKQHTCEVELKAYCKLDAIALKQQLEKLPDTVKVTIEEVLINGVIHNKNILVAGDLVKGKDIFDETKYGVFCYKNGDNYYAYYGYSIRELTEVKLISKAAYSEANTLKVEAIKEIINKNPENSIAKQLAYENIEKVIRG